MSLIYRRRSNQSSLTHLVNDYVGEMIPFAKRVGRPHLLVPLVCLKTVEWSIYKWYSPPVRRLYGVKRNELIYMMTRRCTDKCAKCGIWKTPEPDSERIPIKDFIKCLRALHKNLYQVSLTGGEPLVFMDDVLLIAEESHKLNVPVIVITNGALITKEFLNKYSTYQHTLVISLDTTEKSKWQDFRGRNHYDTVMNNVALAREILGDRLRVQSVYADETKDDIPRVRAFCDELGIYHNSQPYMDFGGNWHGTHIEPPVDSKTPCAARKNICVYYNGDVVKCFDHHRIPLAKEPLGNIAREDIISILCKKRTTEVTKLMKSCNYPCKQLSCNVPPPQFKS